jgi:hypothetical protein
MQMPQGQGPAPTSGGAPPADQVMESMRSPLNPADLAVMNEQGPQIDPNTTTVRQLFEMQGINVDGPVIQLVHKLEQDVGNADMGNKVNAMAQAGPAQNPLEAKMGGAGAPPPPPDDPLGMLMGGR